MRLIWINGPFGIGKTTLAASLSRSLDCPIFDPEEIGFVLREVVSTDFGGDFQNLISWQRAVGGAMSGLLADGHADVVMPMTVYKDEVRQALRRSFAAAGEGRLVEIVLTASHDVLLDRLTGRPQPEHAMIWASVQATAALEAFENDPGDHLIDTCQLDADGVHDLVLRLLAGEAQG